MTTDPIAAARALIEPLTGYTPEPWSVSECEGTGYVYGPAQGYDEGFDLADACLIAAAPDLRNMVAILAVTLEAEQAKVAAAYEAAAKRCYEDQGRFDTPDRIRSLTPADAQAALDKLLAEARAEGWRAGRDAAAIAARGDGEGEWFNPVQAIRALPEPKEAIHD